MAPTEILGVVPTRAMRRERARFFLVDRSGLYILTVVVVILAAGAYSLRKYGIFGCQASGYRSDGYLGYCGATSYGDYDHGAIWFGLEPGATAAAANARVIFIGNSRTQFAFSSPATADWFSSLSESYYLLGFSHWENYTFEAPLLRKLRPSAKVYVINIDSFFEQSASGPGKTVMQDESAKTHYEEKRKWQSIHRVICTSLEAVCGNDVAIFRSRSAGAWTTTGGQFTSEPVSYDEDVDQNKLASSIELGKEFLSRLPVDRGCVIFTMVPTVGTRIGTAEAISAALGFDLVAPRLADLVTFDHFHLDRQSAQRWSAAFFGQAGPQIRACLKEYPESHLAMSSANLLRQ
jgi:hypothetical protein